MSMRLRRALQFWPLVLLCLLIATRWMFINAWPDTQSTVSSQAIAALLASALYFLLAQRSAKSETQSRQPWPWPSFIAGALLFAGMNSGVLAGPASPRGNDLLIALSLVPAVIAVAMSSRSNAGLTGVSVAPGLLAPAGLLLLYSQPAFRSASEDIVMLATPLCAGIGAAWLTAENKQPLDSYHLAFASAGAAILFGMASLFIHTRPALPAVAYDLAVLLLSLLSLSRLGVRRFSAQFVLVPLLLLLEGLAIVQVRPSWTQLGGLALLLAAFVLLVRTREDLEPANTTLFS